MQSNIEEIKADVDRLKDQIDDNFYDERDMEQNIRKIEDKIDEMEDYNGN